MVEDNNKEHISTPPAQQVSGNPPNTNPLIQEPPAKDGSMGKLVRILTVPILLLLAAVYIVPFFIDWEARKTELSTYIRNITGRNVVIVGDMDFSVFPTPSISLEKIKISNVEGGKTEQMLVIDEITTYPAFLPLMFGKIDVDGTEIVSANLNLEDFDTSNPNWDFGNGTNPSEEGNNVLAQFDVGDITIKSLRINYLTGNPDEVTRNILPLKDVELNSDSITGPFDIKGTLFSPANDLDVKFMLETEDLDSSPAEFEFKLLAGESTVSFEGEVEEWETAPRALGEIKAMLDTSIRPVLDYFGIDETILPGGLSSILYAGKTEVGGKFLFSNKMLEVSDFEINSDNTKGSGSLAMAFKKDIYEIAINLMFAELDMDAVLTSDLIEDTDEDLSPFDLAESVRFFVDISVQNASFKDQQIKDLQLQVQLDKMGALLQSLTAKQLPGGTNIEIASQEDSQAIGATRLLAGTLQKSKISITGNDLKAFMEWLEVDLPDTVPETLKSFSVEGDMTFEESKISLPRLKITIDEMSILGQALMKLESGKKPVLNSVFQMKELDLDKILTEEQREALTYIELNDFDEIEDLRKFDFIRKLDLYFKTAGMKLVVKSVKLNDVTYRDFNSVVVLKPGVLDIRKVEFKRIQGKFGIAATIDVKDIRPFISLKLQTDQLDIADIVKTQLPDNVDPSSSRWPISRFTFKRLGIADAKFEMKIKRLVMGAVNLSNVDIRGKINEDAINFERFRAKLFGGNLDIKSVMGIDWPSASASLSLINVSLPKMMQQWFDTKDVMRGVINTNGTVSTSGYTIRSWIENLDGTFNVTGRGIRLNGYNLSRLSSGIRQIQGIDPLREFSVKTLAEGASDVDYLAGTIGIAKGNMDLNQFKLTHPLLRFGEMNARVNLLDWAMDLRSDIKLNLYDTKSKKFEGPTVPLVYTINGSMDGPTKSWDTSGIEQYWEQRFFGR